MFFPILLHPLVSSLVLITLLSHPSNVSCKNDGSEANEQSMHSATCMREILEMLYLLLWHINIQIYITMSHVLSLSGIVSTTDVYDLWNT